MRYCFVLALLFWTIGLCEAQTFAKHWTIESESADYTVTSIADTIDIVAPKGLTLWRNEPMSGPTVVEFDAYMVSEGGPCDRVSDLNCFWMASDPKHPTDIFKRQAWRSGIFVNCYTLQLYYMGYGGNWNKTTRFRRYDGNELGVTQKECRPAILTEYTDSLHLNVPNRWRHIRLTAQGDRVTYSIDGEMLVDYRDPKPLTSGWFGFRTTYSHVRLANFRFTSGEPDAVTTPLRWIETPIGTDSAALVPARWGIPFIQGAVSPNTQFAVASRPVDFYPLAYWPDGSVKWGGFAGALPVASSYQLQRVQGKPSRKASRRVGNDASATTLRLTQTPQGYEVHNGDMTVYLPAPGADTRAFVDSILLGGVKSSGAIGLYASLQQPASSGIAEEPYQFDSATFEYVGHQSLVYKLQGRMASSQSLPVILRLYFTAGCRQVKLVHTLLYDRQPADAMVTAMGLRFDVPMREASYNRHIAFSTADGGVWSEPVQPLSGRRTIFLSGTERNRKDMSPDEWQAPRLQQVQMQGGRVPDYDAFAAPARDLLDHWATWDGFRLSQWADVGFIIRKQAKSQGRTPWIGTYSGSRASGTAFVGDVSGGMAVSLHDFWQSYPSSLEVHGATTPCATLSVGLWTAEAEPMDMRHYDTEAHGLEASYEDVQPGMSTPYGIARTSVLVFEPQSGYRGKETFARWAARLESDPQLACLPQTLHDRRAFGVWSLPDTVAHPNTAWAERLMDSYIDYYQHAIDEHHWYGFWNYGDVMHSYDPYRHEWKYDVGGFAWDNTELGTNLWLWYTYLRTGRPDVWKMAVAMSRHTSEVDVYHLGPHAGLGSRHNVTHWGCGAKESRISQAVWNRFYYYLSGGDERTGDLMHEVRDADTLLYHLDPMRLAQPRDLYPCTAPARLRIGPDWLAYVANWMTEWERTQNPIYRDKILAGMHSIARMPHGIFTGPKALGYDPATGILSWEGDSTLQNTNHLLPIMGGFEMVNELNEMLPGETAWLDTWRTFCRDYRHKADSISNNHFRITRLSAYANYWDPQHRLTPSIWQELRHSNAVVPLQAPIVPEPRLEDVTVSTNAVATWCLDVIYALEVAPL